MKRTIKNLALAGLVGATALLGACTRQEKPETGYSLVKDYDGKPLMVYEGGHIDLGAGKMDHPEQIRFTKRGRDMLGGRGLPEDIAKQYNLRFFEGPNAFDRIVRLHDYGIMPEVANQFPDHIAFDDILTFASAKIDVKEAEKYLGMFDSEDSVKLNKQGVSAEMTQEYVRSRFKISPNDIIAFQNEDISPASIVGYPESVPTESLIKMIKAGLSPQLIQQYTNFFADDAVMLHNIGISPELASRYNELNLKYSGVRINAEDIIKFEEQKISFEEVEKECRRADLETRVRK